MPKSPDDFHMFTFAPPGVWLRLIRQNGGVKKRYWGKLARIMFTTAMASPLRLAERLLWSNRVARVTIDKPPLFVLGFARTGTTHLHNLLAQDPALGYVSTFQAVVPTFALVGQGWLKRLMAKNMRDQVRPMDNVRVALDMPQEEELALAASSHMSAYHQLSFPQLRQDLFTKFIMMEALHDSTHGESKKKDPLPPPSPLSSKEIRDWERQYLNVIRKATILANGQRLVLKSPNNLGRITHLMRLFPSAKFVHIIRNPYVVYRSLIHTFKLSLSMYTLDDYEWSEIERHCVEMFRLMFEKYMADRTLIPEGHLAEIRFEDLERNPLAELERVYTELQLPGWQNAKTSIEEYLGTLSGYRKNAFEASQDVIDRVNQNWKFVVDAWGYEPPQAILETGS